MLPWQPVFEGIKLLQEILKRTMAGTFLWNFIKIRWVVSVKKMFKEKVNGRTDRRMTDNGPWHKLAGLWPVELKNHVSLCKVTWVDTLRKCKKAPFQSTWLILSLSFSYRSHCTSTCSCIFAIYSEQDKVKGLSQLAHDQKWQNICVTDKFYLDCKCYCCRNNRIWKSVLVKQRCLYRVHTVKSL